MESNPHTWIKAVRDSHENLASIVRPLTPERLNGPSYHSWSIAEVLGHLGSQAELFMGWVNAGVEGTDPPGRDAMQPVWDAWNSRSPREKAADSIEYDQRLVERLEALTEEQLKNIHLNLFGMKLDAAGLARMRLGEHAIHTWDIAVAVDPMARVQPEAVVLLIDNLGSVAGRAEKPQGKVFDVTIRTTDPARKFALHVGDDVSLAEDAGTSSDNEIRLPSEALLRIVYGRLDPEHTPTVEVTGPVTLDDLRAVFPGF